MDESKAMLSVQPMLNRIVTQFAAMNGLCRTELFLEAQLVALAAVRTHDPNRRTLVSWVKLLVDQNLYRRVKHPGFRERFGVQLNDIADFQLPALSKFSLNSLLFEISADAAEAVKLAIAEGVEDRSYIETLLHVSFGWTQDKIAKVFQEIQSALE